jgi:anthranilate synthase/aminodeoxychorismate synthase-like glutamine amidotransferase
LAQSGWAAEGVGRVAIRELGRSVGISPLILLIDNYDSFVHNLARYFRRLGQATRVVRNDALTIDEIRVCDPAAIVISPGPCGPAEAGISLEVVRQLASETPILGVCLGHQTIAAAFGGRIVRAREPIHGRASLIRHQGTGMFADLPSPMRVGRYHSLVVDPSSCPEELEPLAWTEDGAVMALRHRHWPVHGVQFHPESVLTEHGFSLLAAFLRIAQLPVPATLPTWHDECPLQAAGADDSPLGSGALGPGGRPVTF